MSITRPLDPRAVTISEHALERFVQRIGTPGPDPLARLEQILEQAVPDYLPAIARVKRLINNGFQRAQYYRWGAYRLVLDADRRVLLTFELDTTVPATPITLHSHRGKQPVRHAVQQTKKTGASTRKRYQNYRRFKLEQLHAEDAWLELVG